MGKSVRHSIVLPKRLVSLHQGLWWAAIVLFATGIYLGSVTLFEWLLDWQLQNQAYQWLFLAHLLVGVAFTPLILWFIVHHFRLAISRPNRKAVRIGLWLAGVILAVTITGWLLLRVEPIMIPAGWGRRILYWLHVVMPVAMAVLYWLHRRVGIHMQLSHLRRRLWALGSLTAALSLVHITVFLPDELQWETPFLPARVAVPAGQTFADSDLMLNGYCERCHQETVHRWAHSAHRFSSLNNPVYRFSIENMRQKLQQRDGHTKASRFCAGCHDPVLLLTGRFDQPDIGRHSDAANEGVNCVACHAVREVPDRIGNGGYRVAKLSHYPFAFSENRALRWLSDQLILAKPDFHKRVMMPETLKKPEFCGACHKVHIPKSVNHYRWLRGQNHLDEFFLSGVSGRGVSSFYYPEEPHEGCLQCHMKAKPVTRQDLAAKSGPTANRLMLKDHLFPSGNTALDAMVGDTVYAKEREEALQQAVRVEIFALRRGGTVDGELIPADTMRLEDWNTARRWLVEVVTRTTGMGHVFTGGTTDSNQVWVQLEAELEDEAGRRFRGISGAIDAAGNVDGKAHWLKAELLARDGTPIRERNVEDIFVALYNRQIPPGAADIASFQMILPEAGNWRRVNLRARVYYRKFSQSLWHKSGGRGKLPVALLAQHEWTLGTEGAVSDSPVPEWQRWNDYGIGLLRIPQHQRLRQAREAFEKVAQYGRAEGHLNLARVALIEGRLRDAIVRINEAIALGTNTPWTAHWLAAQVYRQMGDYAKAHEHLKRIFEVKWRGGAFDFRSDWRLLNLAADTALVLAQSSSDASKRVFWLSQSERYLMDALRENPEYSDTHFNLFRLAALRGDHEAMTRHRALHKKYKVDDEARGHAVLKARQSDEILDFQANPVPIHPLILRPEEDSAP